MSGSGQTVLSSTSHQQHSGIVAPGLMGNPLSPPPMPPVLGASVGIGPQQYTANQHIGYQVCLVSRICGYIFTFYFILFLWPQFNQKRDYEYIFSWNFQTIHKKNIFTIHFPHSSYHWVSRGLIRNGISKISLLNFGLPCLNVSNDEKI